MQIAVKCGLDDGSIATATKFLHDNGSLCYFGDQIKQEKASYVASNRRDKYASLNDIVIVGTNLFFIIFVLFIFFVSTFKIFLFYSRIIYFNRVFFSQTLSGSPKPSQQSSRSNLTS